tara:strand:+ start:103 stop:276 length:174 start_codon:yes stop_codon:yes gene_type:complete
MTWEIVVSLSIPMGDLIYVEEGLPPPPVKNRKTMLTGLPRNIRIVSGQEKIVSRRKR